MRRLALFISILLCATMITLIATADGVYSTRQIINHRVFTSEEEAGILTDEASARIKKAIVEQNVIDIDALLARYFRNCVREDELIIGNTRAAAAVGDSRYKITYDNSGIFTHNKKGGIWRSIFSATISTLLGEVKSVGSILSFTYSVIGGYEPNEEREASAKTQYSYRYVTESG